MTLSRRTILTAGTGALLGLPAVTGSSRAQGPANPPTVAGFNLGCQAWSFNHFTALEAIEKTAQAGGVTIEFYPGQKVGGAMPAVALDPNAPDDALALVKDGVAKAGLRAVAFGVTGLGKNEADDRKTFEFARKMGIGTIVSEPDAASMDVIEKLVKEYDIRMAIHNHPRRANDAGYKFWNPDFVLSLVDGRDKRIGSCSDTGHWVRSGIKPIDALRKLKGRVLEVHLKDLDEFSPGGHDVPFGTGISDIPAVLTELRRQKFDGNISIEYEYNMENSLPQIAQSIGFVRGWGVRAA
jgi:sugar phosphate isomerase/epimerase